MKQITFPALVPEQTRSAQVAFFVSTADHIARIARIDRLARSSTGEASGFQRPQIASHIREIGDYLQRNDALLANPIVLGFVGGATIRKHRNGSHDLVVDVSKGAPGLIVDGQQRFSALMEIKRPRFQVPVSAFICASEEELRRQFILINNTKPLPKRLIYELLPGVRRLPHRLSSRTTASRLVEALNYRKGSSLRGMVLSQTNPAGVITDTIVQRLLMNSLSDGALRLYGDRDRLLMTRGVRLISEYFHAVRHVFCESWDGHTAKSSRLLHGVGVTALGYVMEYVHAATGALDREDFIPVLSKIKPHTAWTDGEWKLGPETRRWNGLQNVSSDWKLLSFYLVGHAKQALAAPRLRRVHR